MIIVQKDLKYINTVTNEPLTAVPFDDCSVEVYFDIYDDTNSLLNPSFIGQLKNKGVINSSIIGLDDKIELGDYYIYDGDEKEISPNANLEILDKINNSTYTATIKSNNNKIKKNDLIVFSKKTGKMIDEITIVSYEKYLSKIPTSAYKKEDNINAEITVENNIFKFTLPYVESGVLNITKKYFPIEIHFKDDQSFTSFNFHTEFNGKILRSFEASLGDKDFTTIDDNFMPITVTSKIESDDESKIGFTVKNANEVGIIKGGVIVNNDSVVETKEIVLKVIPIYNGLEYKEEFEMSFIHWKDFNAIPVETFFVLLYSKKIVIKAVGNNGIGDLSAYIEWPDKTTKDLEKNPEDNSSFIITDESVDDIGDYTVFITVNHTDGYTKTISSKVKVLKTDDIDTDKDLSTGPKYYFQLIFNKKVSEESK